MEMLLILIGISVPLGIYAWRESRHRNPATRWPQLAENVQFAYSPAPPRLGGQWKGRRMTLTAGDSEATLSAQLAAGRTLRVEIGPRAVVEKAAGMVVPDRIELGDAAFEKRYLVRSTPAEIGQNAVDPSMRQRLLQLPDVRVLATGQELRMGIPCPTEAGELRTYFDIAASLAESMDGS